MKITQNVREYAKEQGVAEEKALAVGMTEKTKEFVATGSEIYHGNLPDGANEHQSLVGRSFGLVLIYLAELLFYFRCKS